MKIAIINAVIYGSTGGIAREICDSIEEDKQEAILLVPRTRENLKYQYNRRIIFGSILTRNISSRIGFLFGKIDFLNFYNTVSLIIALEHEKPNIIHLHNIHGSYLNYKMLFRYIKHRDIPVVWTFHDCWPFTGRCPHFTLVGCDKWKRGCYECNYSLTEYPETNRHTEQVSWRQKEKYFKSIQNMHIVTPSKWLADLANQSFFKGFNIRVINNGIDIKVFTPGISSLRTKYNIEAKYIILCVAFGWGRRKGLDAVIEMANRVTRDYQIVIVGTSQETDNLLPSTVISIHRTSNVMELVDIYRGSDVFFNPTREEVFGLVNVEALACGLPVVTYNTGGSPECINPESGVVVKDNTVETAIGCIKQICEEGLIDREKCVQQAYKFDNRAKIREYVDLYKMIYDDMHMEST